MQANLTMHEVFAEKDGMTQLMASLEALFDSWAGEKIQRHRSIEGLPRDGLAVLIQPLVIASQVGVCYSRHPTSGASQVWA